MNATCRQVEAPSSPVLSYDIPVSSSPSSGTMFHSLQATSQALQPMQTEVSVRNPIRAGCSASPASAAGSGGWPGSGSAASPRNVSAAPGHDCGLMSQLRPGLAGDPGALLVLTDKITQGRPARPPAGADVAGQRLDLLDVHVRVEGQVRQLDRKSVV